MPFFDRFERIYLWLDSDEVGKRSAEKFAEVLGSDRTFIIDPSANKSVFPKDANDALRQGISFREFF